VFSYWSGIVAGRPGLPGIFTRSLYRKSDGDTVTDRYNFSFPDLFIEGDKERTVAKREEGALPGGFTKGNGGWYQAPPRFATEVCIGLGDGEVYSTTFLWELFNGSGDGEGAAHERSGFR